MSSTSPIVEKSALEVQALSMQWLDFHRTGQYVGWKLEKLAASTLGKVAKAVVEQFNGRQKEESAHFQRHKCTFDHPQYKLKVYAKNISMTPKLVKDLTEKGAENLKKKKGNEILLFFCRSVPKREIVILSSDQAWRVVRHCINYQYPIKIAERILDPSKIVEISRRCLVGPNLRETILHPSEGELYKTSSLYYLVESFKCVAKVNASLMNVPPFSHQKKSVPPTVKITSGGLLRIMKRLSLEDYPALFNLFYQYTHALPTYSGDGKLETNDPQFEFLHFVQPAQVVGKILDRCLIERIWASYEKQDPLPGYFRHKYLNEFLNSTSFEIQYKTKRRFEKLPSRPPTLQEILEAIDGHSDDLDAKSLLAILSDGQLRYIDEASRRVIDASLIECVEAEVRYREKAYFKIRGMWYQLAADFNALLIDDFRALLKQKLLMPQDEGQLPNTWKGNKPQDVLTERNVTKVLGSGKGIRKFMQMLDKAQMCYVDATGKVTQKKLVGAILQVPLIAKNRVGIEKELTATAKTSLLARLKKAFPKDATAIMDALKQDRPILQVVRKGNKKERRVLNPATYPLRALLGKQEAAFAAFLEAMCANKGTEDEAAYNRTYLYDNMNGGKPFGPQKGYLVFDRVLPNHIEPCDVVQYTPKTTRLYHVKEDLGQHTRDACSQILSAAKAFRAALSTHQPKDFIQMLWDLSVSAQNSDGWRGKIKTQMEALGKKNFFNIFTERKIVFVYAYLERQGHSLHTENATPRTVPSSEFDESHFKELKNSGYIDYHNRLTGKFYETSQTSFKLAGFEDSSLEIYKKLSRYRPVSDSTLAKLELIHLARELQALNFELEICEIRRPDSPWEAQQGDGATQSEETAPDNADEDSIAGSITTDEESGIEAGGHDHEEVVDGPSGLANIGNSCYMNACLQAIHYLAPIRDPIEAQKNGPVVISRLAQALEKRDRDSLIKLRDALFQNRKAGTLTGSKSAQHDGHELLVFLLDQLQWQPMMTYTYFSYKPPKGIDKKSHRSEQSPCNHLSLAVLPDQSFQDLLGGYFQTDLIEDAESPLQITSQGKIYPTSKYSRAERIAQLPDLLIIHLKRFDRQMKIGLPIAFPEDRTVTIQQRNKDPETVYTIVGFINHHGGSMHGGHYTADIKDLTSEDERWLHCDDSLVTEAEPADPENDAYMVFLKKIED